MRSEECDVCANDKRHKLYRYGLGSFCEHTSDEVWWVYEGRQNLEQCGHLKCVICGRRYVHIGADSSFNYYCSNACEKVFNVRRDRERLASKVSEDPETECAHCGTKFVAKRNAKYCSPKCRAAARQART